MATVVSLDRQQAETELILRSGLFAKAPRLERFFRYICERHLAGEADRIKEYTIATEALGRGSEFDPKTDSIVRVEAYRLRKRLETYYAREGSPHSVRIGIPSGQYRPAFCHIEPDGPALIETPHSAVIGFEPATKRTADHRLSSSRLLVWAAVANVSFIVVTMAIQHYRGRR